MKSELLKTFLLAALIAPPLASPKSSARAQSRSLTQNAAPPSAQSTDEKWERYTYAGEEFSVEMPEMPFAFESGRLVSVTKSEPMRTFGLYSRGIVLIVTSFENPQELETSDRFATYNWGGGGLSFTRDVKLGDFVGREYESAVGVHGRARVFRTKQHAYVVWAMSKAENDPRVTRFLDSFTLGGKPAGVAIFEPPPPAVPVPSETAPVITKGPGQSGPASSGHAAGEPYSLTGVARRAVIVFKPPPDFSKEARRKSTTGTVIIRAVLGAEGRVRGISVVRGLPDGLTDKAIDAARYILFFPAEVDGRAVSQYVTLEYNFNIY